MRLSMIILISGILVLNLSAASFEDIGSVRARGMGDAFESISAGIDSVHYNPAGTAYLESLQVFTEYGKPAVFFDDEASFNSMHFGVSCPFSRQPYLIWLNYLLKGLTIGNEDKVVRDGSFSFIFHDFFVYEFMHEFLFTMNIGKSLNTLFEGANMAVGVNFNIFNHGFVMTEDLKHHPDYNILSDSSTGFGVDVGMTYDFSKFIRLSFVMANLIEPNISFLNNESEYVNQQMRAGLAWQLGDTWYLQDLLASIGFVQISRDSDDGRASETIYKAGAEFWQWKKRIGFRMGFKTYLNIFSTGLSYKQKIKNSPHHILFHYAFNYPFRSKNIKNYFSLNYQFDFPDHFFDYRKESDIEKQNKEIMDNFNKGMVIVKYKTLPNDNLYNISLIHYGTPGQAELLKEHNKIEDDKELPEIMEVPFDAKAFGTYKIQSGDTLEFISEKIYGTTEKIEKIRKFNKIEFSRLRLGRILVLPLDREERKKLEEFERDREQMLLEQERKRKEEEEKKKREEEERKKEEEKKEEKEKKEEEKKKPEAKTPAVVPTVEKKAPAVKEGEIKIHVIEAGDNLGKISSKYYGTQKHWQKLAEYNGLKPPNYNIRLGMKLKIPELSELEK